MEDPRRGVIIDGLEGIFYRIASGILGRIPKGLLLFCYRFTLAMAVSNIALFLTLHVSYVGSEGCSMSILPHGNSSLFETDIVEIRLAGWWTELSQRIKNESLSGEIKDIGVLVKDVCTILYDYDIDPYTWPEFANFLQKQHIDEHMNQFLLDLSEQLDLFGNVYRFSRERGLLLLSHAAGKKHNVTHSMTRLWVGKDECVGGGGLLTTILNELPMWDVLVLNAVGHVLGRSQKGYFQDVDYGEIYQVKRTTEPLLHRLGPALVESVLVYVIVTVMTLTVMQSIAKQAISFLIRHQMRGRISLSSPIAEILSTFALFVSFFGTAEIARVFTASEDVAVFILAWIWIAESWGILFARTKLSIKVMPFVHFFCIMGYLLYHSIYNVGGFSYMALVAFSNIQLAFSMYLLVFHECPAFRDGSVTIMHPRVTE